MAETSGSKRSKRRLRAPSQTVRQQAAKAQIDSEKPAKARRLRAVAAASGKPFRRFGKLFDRQPFRFIGKVLRPIGRIIVPRYFRTAWQELRLVEWPNRRQSRDLTVAVLGFAIIFGAAIAGVDYGLDKVFKAVLLK